jgi:hypothetical protein
VAREAGVGVPGATAGLLGRVAEPSASAGAGFVAGVVAGVVVGALAGAEDARAVVGEELVPGLVHAGGIGEVLLVHLLDQPLVGAETRHRRGVGGGRVG